MKSSLLYLIGLLALLLFSCSKDTNNITKDNCNIWDQPFQGFNRSKRQTIKVFRDSITVYIATSSGNWQEYMEGEIIFCKESKLAFKPTFRVGLGLCKNYRWGSPVLGISLGDHAVAEDYLKDIQFRVINADIDTVIYSDSLVSYYNMPVVDDTKVDVKVIVSLLEKDVDFNYDTLNFNYYRTMICISSSLPKVDALELEVLGSSLVYRGSRYYLVDE